MKQTLISLWVWSNKVSLQIVSAYYGLFNLSKESHHRSNVAINTVVLKYCGIS